MDKEKYIEDLREIKNIMSRTTQFISLSGLSGVSIGITALIGAYLAFKEVFKGNDYFVYDAVELTSDSLCYLLIIAVGTLLVSIANAIFFTWRKNSKTLMKNDGVTNQTSELISMKTQKIGFLDTQTKRLLINLFIPLITGGILCLMLLNKGFVGILPSLTLIFYGLALVNGSKYTIPEIRTLGIIEISLGLFAFQFIEYGLFFWAFGFGIVQIIYGLIIQWKY